MATTAKNLWTKDEWWKSQAKKLGTTVRRLRESCSFEDGSKQDLWQTKHSDAIRAKNVQDWKDDCTALARELNKLDKLSSRERFVSFAVEGLDTVWPTAIKSASDGAFSAVSPGGSEYQSVEENTFGRMKPAQTQKWAKALSRKSRVVEKAQRKNFELVMLLVVVEGITQKELHKLISQAVEEHKAQPSKAPRKPLKQNIKELARMEQGLK